MKARLGLQGGSFESVVIPALTFDLAEGPDVYVGEWQALQDGELPQASTIEVEDVSFWTPLQHTVEAWQQTIRPNLPWAEEHFLERVSGRPLNPPPSHVRWPFAQRGNETFTKAEKFSHTYPERFWPRSLVPDGIRYRTGDLADVVRLLKERPGTRQAYLPVWFPEDLGATEADVRVPCTLGYHFLVRMGALKVTYYIRSCDFYRHFRDDVYMAGRLGQWVASQLRTDHDEEVVTSRLVMHISSLHIFSAERGRARDDADRLRTSQFRRTT